MTRFVDSIYEGEIYRQRAIRIHEAISQGVDVYLKLLASENSYVRGNAATLLTKFVGSSPDLVSVLLDMMTSEKDDSLVVRLVVDFGDMLPKEALGYEVVLQYLNILRDFLSSDRSADLKTLSALYSINLLTVNAPFEAVDHLVARMINSESTEASEFRYLYVYRKSQALVKLGSGKGLQAAVKIIREAQDLYYVFFSLIPALLLAFNPHNLPYGYSIAVYETLAKVVFSAKTHPWDFAASWQPELPNLASLDYSQRQVIDAIISNRSIWSVETNILSRFGLPNNWEQLKELVSANG
jgi:hypothetical protein